MTIHRARTADRSGGVCWTPEGGRNPPTTRSSAAEQARQARALRLALRRVSAPENSAIAAPDPLRGIAPVLLALLGAGFGASVFAEGFYDITVWGPIGIG